MKKIERYIYISLIIILVGVIASGTTYILMKDNNKTEVKENNNQTETDNNQENKEPVTKKDSVKLNKVYNLNDKIVEEFEITLNGKSKTMNITFNYDEEKYDTLEEHTLNIVSGSLNNNPVISYLGSDETKNNIYNTAKVKEKFNENNFKIIKGTDNKSYLLLITNTAYVTIYESKLLIFNDNLEQIKENFNTYWKSDSMTIVNDTVGFRFENDLKPYYKNHFNIDFKADPNNILPGVNVKIENNKIYYLALILKEKCQDGDLGIIEEREYYLHNNELEYKVINKYKVIEVVAGQVAC